MRKLLTIVACCLAVYASAQKNNFVQQKNRWNIQQDGSIIWNIADNLPHADHIEMSGQKVSMWVQYEVDTTKAPHVSCTMVFPSFRLQPNKTHSSMMYTISDNDVARFFINDQLFKTGIYNGAPTNGLPEQTISIKQKGIMEIVSTIGKDRSLLFKRTLFPSDKDPLAIEKFVFVNTGSKPAKVELEYMNKEIRPAEDRTINGPHRFIASTIGAGSKMVQPGDSVEFAMCFQAVHINDLPLNTNVESAEEGRIKRVTGIGTLLQLETPDTLLNTAFSFAKIRATESIYLTKGGYLHGPGGLRYYAAIWANDQAEYVNPFFAFLGDDIANKSAMNAYRWFAKFMNPDYNPIPSSIISEGAGTWHGAGDRGDMAMIAYGASRYALAAGNRDSAEVLYPLIEWCLEYLHRKLNDVGVVASKSDELEGRFPAGNANLNTSSLYYDALRSAVLLGKSLGKPKAQLEQYDKQAKELLQNINKFFGATMDGFETYRYYEGNTVLRAWIATPLTVNIFDRKDGTITALFSPKLWTADGLASLAGDKTFWDRSTLYALRGVLSAGETEKGMDYLRYYSRRRLLGEHVPYPVEAYPEGNQRHLSAESGLYCRIYTEGLFGMRPTGLNSFDCTPRLPKEWDKMALRNIHSFGNVFDVEVTRTNAGKLNIIIKKDDQLKTYTIKENETKSIEL
jgi:hypothetical protein